MKVTKPKIEMSKTHENCKKQAEVKKNLNKSSIVEKEKMDKNKTAVKSKDQNEKSVLKTNEKVIKKPKEIFPKTEKKKESKL